MTSPQIEEFIELKKTLRWRLVGAGMHRALAALDFVEPMNIDKHGDLMMRKDGKTPKFFHEIRQANNAMWLPNVMDREGLIITILCHDIMEDFATERDLIITKFGHAAFTSIWAMTKKYKGIVKSPAQVFADIAADKNASLAKLLDRIDNFQSMVGVFSDTKQGDYLDEGDEYFLKMGKEGRKNFPEQLDAYLCLMTFMRYQMELLRARLALSLTITSP